jgi:hypothetical protein
VIRAIFRTRIGRVLEVSLEVGHELAEGLVYLALRRRLGIPAMEERVRALEAIAARMEREDEERARSSSRFVTPASARLRRAG